MGGKDGQRAVPEPAPSPRDNLLRGLAYQEEVRDEWMGAQGGVTCELGVTKPSGRRGRIDVHVDAGGDLVAVVEFKDSDFDRMTLFTPRLG